MRWFKKVKYLIIPLVILGIFEVMNSRDIISGESNVPEYGLEEFRAGVPLPDEYKSICEMWRDKYPIIPNLSTPYTLRGEATMTLSPEEWSREIVFLNTMNFDVSDPLEFQLQNGEILTISPNQGLIDLRGEKVMKIRGVGCIRFSFK